MAKTKGSETQVWSTRGIFTLGIDRSLGQAPLLCPSWLTGLQAKRPPPAPPLPPTKAIKIQQCLQFFVQMPSGKLHHFLNADSLGFSDLLETLLNEHPCACHTALVLSSRLYLNLSPLLLFPRGHPRRVGNQSCYPPVQVSFLLPGQT